MLPLYWSWNIHSMVKKKTQLSKTHTHFILSREWETQRFKLNHVRAASNIHRIYYSIERIFSQSYRKAKGIYRTQVPWIQILWFFQSGSQTGKIERLQYFSNNCIYWIRCIGTCFVNAWKRFSQRSPVLVRDDLCNVKDVFFSLQVVQQ